MVNQNLRKELQTLKEKSGLSVADVLLVGLGKCAPLVGDAYYKGFVAALAEMYEVTCDECEDRVIDLYPNPSSS